MSDPSERESASTPCPLPLSDDWFERTVIYMDVEDEYEVDRERRLRAVAAAALRWAADDAERKRAGVQLGDKPGTAAMVLIRVRDQLRARADAIEGER